MDRYMKVVFTVIAIALVSLAVKDVDLFPIAEAQQGWEIDNERAMNGSMQALPESSGLGYICFSALYPLSKYYGFGRDGSLHINFRTEPQCMGDYIGSGWFYSVGADHSLTDDRYLLNSNQMQFYANASARAADTGQRVRYTTCDLAKLNCLKYVRFRGDPADVAAD